MIRLAKRLFVCFVQGHILDEHCTCKVCGQRELHVFLPRDEMYCKCSQCGEKRTHTPMTHHAPEIGEVCVYCRHFMGHEATQTRLPS